MPSPLPYTAFLIASVSSSGIRTRLVLTDDAEAANDIFDQSVPANMGSITTLLCFVISLNMASSKFSNASSLST